MRPLKQETSMETLRQAALILEAENQKLVEKNVELTKELLQLKGQSPEELQQRIARLEEELARQRKALFGDSSEQRPKPRPEATEKKPQTGHGPREQKELETVEEIHRLDEADQVCPQCGGELKEWEGQFEESEEVDSLERVFFVRRHKRQKYRCGCMACVETALGPPKLIPGGRYTPDFAVEVAGEKYLEHAPLERQVRKMEREGLTVTSSTLWDQIEALAKHLAPVHERLHAYILARPLIHMDETHWKYLGSNGGEHEQKRWQTWVIATGDAVSYRILPSRSIEAAREVLQGYRGRVMADGYGVYEHLAKHDGIILLSCWAHARRKFVELENSVTPEVRDEILKLIGELYEIEREGKESPELLRRLREERGRVVMARIREWLFAQKTKALPRSGLATAVNYVLERWTQLTMYLDDPKLPIDNNAAERAMRGPVVGRKNHYGSKSQRGTEVAALLYSLCESAKLCGINPKVYLRGAIWAALRGEEVPLPHELKAQLVASRSTR